METSLVVKARDFAEWVHRKQRRKYGGEPYFSHLTRVAYILAAAGYDETVVAAGYLHDAVEDQEVTRELLVSLFGVTVARVVDEVTDRSRPEDGNRRARKEIDRVHLTEASPDGQAVKLADLIDNSVSIIYTDPDFAEVYMREKRAILDTVPWAGSNAALLARARAIVDAYEQGRGAMGAFEDVGPAFVPAPVDPVADATVRAFNGDDVDYAK